MSLEFFSEIDKNGKGRVASEYPAWYHDIHVDLLRENVESSKRRLNRGEVPRDQIAMMKMEIEVGEEKLREIENCKPKLSVGERVKLQKLYVEELCPLISGSLFTYKQIERNLASGHEEARRMVEPIFEVKSELLAEMVKATGGLVVKGKASRNTLAKVFKLVGKLIEESTNIETLRKD